MTATTTTLHQASFKERFCSVYQCPPEEFEERVFRLCLHRRARLFAGRARPGVPGFFGWDWDFDFINSLANIIDTKEALTEINTYVYHHPPIGLFKGWLRIRVSGRYLMRLIEEVFAADGAAPPSAHPALPGAGTDT